MTAYGEFRAPFNKDPSDHRLIFYGLHYFIQHYVAKQWTMEMLEQTRSFFSTHNASHTTFPFPETLFEKVIAHN
jgi:hypothetical protein